MIPSIYKRMKSVFINVSRETFKQYIILRILSIIQIQILQETTQIAFWFWLWKSLELLNVTFNPSNSPAWTLAKARPAPWTAHRGRLRPVNKGHVSWHVVQANDMLSRNFLEVLSFGAWSKEKYDLCNFPEIIYKSLF